MTGVALNTLPALTARTTRDEAPVSDPANATECLFCCVSGPGLLPATIAYPAGVDALPGEGALADRLALAFLAGYMPGTRTAYARDLRDFYRWCADHDVDVLAATRAHADAFARELDEVRHLAPATLARRLSAVAGLFAYAVAEEVLDRSPLAHIKRPKVADDSQSTGLDRDEARSLLAAAQASGPRDYAVVALLLFNGLRVSEVVTAKIEHLDYERGHRVLRIVRKGGKRATVPLAPRVADALDTYLGDRSGGALFLSVRGRAPLDRTAIWRILRKLARNAVPAKAGTLHPHDLRHAFVTLALDCGATLRDVQDAAGHADPRTTRRYDRARHNLDRHPTYTLSGLGA